MSDDPKITSPGFESPEGQTAIAIMEQVRGAVAAMDLDWIEPNTASIVASALSNLVGQMFGGMLIAGWVRPQDQRRFVEACAANIRSGITVGQRRGARIEREIMGSATQ